MCLFSTSSIIVIIISVKPQDFFILLKLTTKGFKLNLITLMSRNTELKGNTVYGLRFYILKIMKLS